MKFTIDIDVDPKRITDLVTSALEGGSNYWYTIDTRRSVRGGGEFIVDAPMAGGKLCVRLLDTDPPDDRLPNFEVGPGGHAEWWLTKETCYDGLRIMADVAPRHFTNWLKGDDDAETGDVFLQCALFGEVIFG